MHKIPLLIKTVGASIILLGLILIGSLSLKSSDASGTMLLIFGLLSAFAVAALVICYRLRFQMFYLEGSLDALEQPVTTTDMNMKWKFINSVTETLLAQHNLNKRNVIGKHCSNWKADICETENCGVQCLRKNKPRTHYNQEIPNSPSIYMQVDTNYIHDDMGRRIGHVEVVTNVDAISQLRKTVRVIGPAANSMLEVSSNLTDRSGSMSSQTATVTKSMQGLSANLSNVADSSTEMSDSINSFATAVEEMSSTAAEISKNCASAAEISSNADTKAKHNQQTVERLASAAQEIGNILNTIEEIANQTNLLALNATIEAASAGEAGKGFAVVATEVKELAKQTATATEQISSQINNIQATATQSSEAISEISNIIEEINGITQTIAAAVEEQSATVNEISQSVSHASSSARAISENVKNASDSANEISVNIQDLNTIADSTSSDAITTRQNAEKMSQLSVDLDKLTLAVE